LADIFSWRSRSTLAVLGAGMILTSAVPNAFAQAGELNDDIRHLVNGGKLGNAKVGISIIDEDSGLVLGALNGDRPLIPASNMKVLTSGAAIMILGPDFVFRTELIRKGNSLIIRGDGDPALADPEVLDETEPRMTADDVLEFLANAARKDGMTSAEELIVDDRVFDREFLHPEWPEKNLMMPHSAQISGLNFHANVLSIFPKPSREGVGRPPTFTL
jgi:D-alanyl-D-alanine carboxypeptidase/D-alanyl-D-alanine-endopeptidase (penicillin-binding protein 4)